MHRLASVLTAAALVALPACSDSPGDNRSAATAPPSSPTMAAASPSPSPQVDVDTVVDDFLAAIGSDSERAWELMSPQAQQTWGSFDTFAEASTEFAEGLAAFSVTQERERLDVDEDLLVVVVSGDVTREGSTEYDAYALPVRLEGGGALVELTGPELPGLGRAEFEVPGQTRAPVEPGTQFSAYVPAEAEAAMWLDGREIVAEQTAADGDRTQLTATPELAAGWHIVAVTAVRADGLLLAHAVAFQVS